MTVLFADSSSIIPVLNVVYIAVGCAAVALMVRAAIRWRGHPIDRDMLRAQLIGCVGILIIGWQVLLPVPIWVRALAMLFGAGIVMASAIVTQRVKDERRRTSCHAGRPSRV